MKRLPTLSKSQRRGLLLLEWLLLIGFACWFSRRWMKSTEAVLVEVRQRAWNNAPAKPFTFAEQERAVEVFPFDPNTADSTTLLRLGLSPWQVRAIYRYRAKLGRYSTPEDFMNVPNLTNEQWLRLKDYIRIDERYRYVMPESSRRPFRRGRVEEPLEPKASASEPQVSTPEPQVSLSEPTDLASPRLKLQPGETVDVNTADTSLLKMIPGIASRRAARIVAYRQELGGFVNVEQAMEAIEMPDSVLHYMTITPVEVRRINVNRQSVRQLMRHPYLSFYQAKAIFEHRKNKGELKDINDLRQLEGFRPTDIDRLRPYLSFD